MNSKRHIRRDRSREEQYDYHLPVMRDIICDYVVWKKDGIYVDGTLGGGGHTGAIVERLSEEGRLYSFDADKEAIRHCSERFAEEINKGRLTLIHDNFIRACSIEELRGKASGLLLDLGVSSKQLDSAQRGISHRVNAPLDMRFGDEGECTAADILNEWKEEDIERIMRVFGEEPFSRAMARRIIQRRRAAPLRTTFDLRDVAASLIPPHILSKSLARIFQAFRIAVNDELSILEQMLRGFIPFLESHGRIVIMSYHSLEDRIVKNVFRDFSRDTDDTPAMVKIITSKPLEADEEEIMRNPRARSVKIRVAEKK
jgi:16S rRNA (cytosine1402-N4)-methyltransferase